MLALWTGWNLGRRKVCRRAQISSARRWGGKKAKSLASMGLE